jgi:hypothetical protein
MMISIARLGSRKTRRIPRKQRLLTLIISWRTKLASDVEDGCDAATSAVMTKRRPVRQL